MTIQVNSSYVIALGKLATNVDAWQCPPDGSGWLPLAPCMPSYGVDAYTQIWTLVGTDLTSVQFQCKISDSVTWYLVTEGNPGNNLTLTDDIEKATSFTIGANGSIGYVSSSEGTTLYVFNGEGVGGNGGIILGTPETPALNWTFNTPAQPLQMGGKGYFLNSAENGYYLTANDGNDVNASIISHSHGDDSIFVFSGTQSAAWGTFSNAQIKSLSGQYIYGMQEQSTLKCVGTQLSAYCWLVEDDGYGTIILTSKEGNNVTKGYLFNNDNTPYMKAELLLTAPKQKWKFTSNKGTFD